MNRNPAVLSSVVLTVALCPCLAWAAKPCPPPSLQVQSGSAVTTVCAARTYSSTFDVSENPLSESGEWINVGLDWTPVVTAASNAYGTHHNTGYNDSYAHLSGFAPDQSIRGTVFKTGTFTEHQEIELHLRWADSAHVARGYEILIEANNLYSSIVRWNGALGDFTILADYSIPRAPVTGDVLEAKITGGTITVLFNGTIVGTATDSTWTTGDPGIGFFSRDPTGEPNSRFAWSDIAATDL